ncbi:MAG: hypothetical protein BIFFINMI_03015 [Phycisphaerae bacterium]|nr:hypothetical protein [Phycisphaerae bacterium]
MAEQADITTDAPATTDAPVALPPTMRGGARLGPLAAGGLGLLGFALAIIQGLAVGNDTTAILTRALVVMAALALVGAVAGGIAGRVVTEQTNRLAREQAEADRLAGLQASSESEVTSDVEAKDGPRQAGERAD